MPSVDELTAAGGPRADLCSTLAWALRAPIDIAAAATPTDPAGELDVDEDGPAALALNILERLELARAASLEEGGLTERDIAQCLEQVGRAMLLQRVDAALEVLDNKPAFGEAAALLCTFSSNAGSIAVALQVAPLISDVFYEGDATRRRLEKLYRGCLVEAAPELLASMGMGAEPAENSGGPSVGLDTVERLRPALGVKEQKGQKLVQDVMQQQMMSMIQGEGDEGDEGKAMARSVAMLEQLIDSGSVQPEDLASLKDMIAQSMGMPVDELLARREELQAEMPPEGRKLFTLIERLFGDGSKPSTAAANSGEAMAGGEAAEDDPYSSTVVTVREGALPPPPPPAPTDAKVTVRVKRKHADDGEPTAPAAAAVVATPPAPAGEWQPA